MVVKLLQSPGSGVVPGINYVAIGSRMLFYAFSHEDNLVERVLKFC